MAVISGTVETDVCDSTADYLKNAEGFIQAAFLAGFLKTSTKGDLNLINAPFLAKEKGYTVCIVHR